MPRTAAASMTRDDACSVYKATPNGNTTERTEVQDLPILNAGFMLNELRNEHVNDRVRPPIGFKLTTFTLVVVVYDHEQSLGVGCEARLTKTLAGSVSPF